jgi:hypothetical protein
MSQSSACRPLKDLNSIRRDKLEDGNRQRRNAPMVCSIDSRGGLRKRISVTYIRAPTMTTVRPYHDHISVPNDDMIAFYRQCPVSFMLD